MTRINFSVAISACLCVWIFSSCKKESAGNAPFAFYSIEVHGSSVTFSNKSEGATTYKWDFGDGTESTEESPTHEYPGKGKYVPTLYATSADGVTSEASTVINISKTSGIKLDDHSLADWDTVTHNVVVGGSKSGKFYTGEI
jgi:PKD repeat protein